MAKLLENLQKEMIKAMKEKQEKRLSVLRMLITEIKNEDKIKGKKREELDICRAYHKKLTKSLDMFPEDKKESIKEEIKVVEEFLPNLMSKEEVIKFIKENIETDKVEMKTIMPLLKGKADGNTVKEIVLNWNK
jgi:uncharacterized protein